MSNSHVSPLFRIILDQMNEQEAASMSNNRMPCHISDGPQYPPEWDSEITDEDRDNATFEAEERIKTSEFWDYRELALDISDQIARAMQCIDLACNGDKIAIDACLDALAKIQKHAILNETESILDGD